MRRPQKKQGLSSPTVKADAMPPQGTVVDTNARLQDVGTKVDIDRVRVTLVCCTVL